MLLNQDVCTAESQQPGTTARARGPQEWAYYLESSRLHVHSLGTPHSKARTTRVAATSPSGLGVIPGHGVPFAAVLLVVPALRHVSSETQVAFPLPPSPLCTLGEMALAG